MSRPIGILLNKQVLAAGLRGRKTVERVALYRKIAHDELGLDVVVFGIEDVNFNRNRVTGYAPTKHGWRRTRVRVPHVIHKRVLYRTNAPLRKIHRLHRRGIVFVNPPLIQNKQNMNAVLSKDPSVRDHLPPTSRYRWSSLEQMLDSGTGVILKPRVGSVGQGILRLLPREGRRTEITGMRTRLLSRRALRKQLRRRLRPGRYLLQEYINLAQYEGRPFDLRVPVQRDGKGRWVLPGIVAKVASKHPFLTNAGRGGRVLPGDTVLTAAFPNNVSAVIDRVEQLALNVARAVARNHRYAADLGLDMGVDADGKPWLIEVNTRDQRYTFYEAGMHEAFHALYRNPLAFCAHLNQTLLDGKNWSPPDLESAPKPNPGSSTHQIEVKVNGADPTTGESPGVDER